MNGPDRFAEIREAGPYAVARALGLEADPRRGIRRCPACGMEQRSDHDKRPAVGFATSSTSGDALWVHSKCGNTGDAVHLAGLVLFGTRRLNREQSIELLERLGNAGLCTPLASRDTPPRRAPIDPGFLVRRWREAVPVTSDPDTASSLVRRGLDPELIARRNLARVVVPDRKLAIPLVDANDGAAGLMPVHPHPSGVAGDGFARLLLRRGAFPDGTPAATVAQETGVALVDVRAFLAWACSLDGDERAPALIGLCGGAIPDDVAGRIPDGTPLFVQTRASLGALHQRCTVRRVASPTELCPSPEAP